jgi:hypothetical protein
MVLVSQSHESLLRAGAHEIRPTRTGVIHVIETMISKDVSMKRHYVVVAGTTFFLAQGLDVQTVKDSVVAALRAGGGLVDLVVVGNVGVSVAISPGVVVIFQSEEIDFDSRDSGDLADPYRPFVSMEAFEDIVS